MSFDHLEKESVDVVAETGELRKLLEWELSLDSGDLRSHAWYHGTIPRARAEEVVLKDGSFLIRWTVVQPNTVYERIQYQLEDDAYDSIPDLVRAYVGGKKPITVSSGARISTPVNRTAPLSFYASKYAAQTAHTFTHGTLSRPSNRASEPIPGGGLIGGNMLRHQHSYSGPVGVGCAIVRSPAHSPPRTRRDTAPLLPIKTRSMPTRIDEKSCSNDGVIGSRPTVEQNKFTSQSLPRKMTTKSFSIPSEHLSPISAEPTLGGHEEDKPIEKSTEEEPPPKPSRVPSFKTKPKKPPQPVINERLYAEIDELDEEEMKDLKTEDVKTPTASSEADNNVKNSEVITGCMDTTSTPRHSRLSEMYQPSGSDSGNGSGDSVQTSASDARNRDSQASFGDTGSVQLEEDSVVDEEPVLFSLPEVLAAHLTRVDLELLNGAGENDLGLGVTSGIELITLPHGAQLRTDLIERTECLKLLVAVTILLTPDLNERSEVIHRWIQVAIDTKTAMGNLYGFTGIMLGLCVPEGASILQWESTASDYGMQMLFSHLQETRAVTQNLTLYRRNAEHILPDSNTLDDLTLDMFRTEFHLKFLWGSKGAVADSEERHAKFQQVVSTLSERCEPSLVAS
ncbi:Breast cancer anti-estrogen resistance protein 3-like [Homarus americanus]|uniref:Breast cancer anti-estrogen resistance protein 3-like n=1 Tax=Homarus americanus TaxID=6706 RepID=A0A8J5N3W5_HOMAM|nr:Breast cancer anti-estrogen resistance protein 3-like [Homarus americanus]